MNFWNQIKKPIIALSPMDGVTDVAFRWITARHGKPDIHFTEFVNVEGLARNAVMMLDDFLFDEIERPIVAQIYGSEPESFYKIAILVCELGFDGIDINMGCPAKKVASRGCGAGLILNPPLAKTIVRAVQKGVVDWVNGKSIDDLGLKLKMIKQVHAMNALKPKCTERKPLPVSVKTRLGYDKIVIQDWVQHLLEVEPATISIHGRTLKQMYTGCADWDAIAQAAEIIKKTSTLVLGNGDLKTTEAIIQNINHSGVHGVLIGRGALGNPWLFQNTAAIKQAVIEKKNAEPPSPPEAQLRFEVLLEHARHFEKVRGRKRFAGMRKHFAWYCKNMHQASQLRNQLCQTDNSLQVEAILQTYQKEFPLEGHQ